MLLSDKDNLAKQLYEVTNFSQRRLASLLGVTLVAYQRWLLGKQPNEAHSARLRELLATFQGDEDVSKH